MAATFQEPHRVQSDAAAAAAAAPAHQEAPLGTAVQGGVLLRDASSNSSSAMPPPSSLSQRDPSPASAATSSSSDSHSHSHGKLAREEQGSEERGTTGNAGENTSSSETSEGDAATTADKTSSRGEVVEKGPDGQDVIWVEFEPDDPENPFNFSPLRKYSIAILATIFTAEVAATASAYVAGIPSMTLDLSVTNRYLPLLGTSLYPLGFGLPPLVLAPFSEVFGRSPVYFVSYIIYLACFVGVGLAPNITCLLIFRFLQGAAGSTGSTLVGGTIADFTSPQERGKFMALFATAAIGGTGFGPAWAGWVEQNTRLGWRYIQWIQLAYTGAIFIAFVFILKETRGSVILTRRAARLRKETGDERYRARAEAERASLAILVKNSLTRPIWFLISEPIVTWFSIWISWLWAVMYSLLNSIGLVSRQHAYSPGQQGSIFWAICFAACIGQATNGAQNWAYRKYYPVKGPEARLYSSMVCAVLFPVGCFIYAWTSFPQISIAGPVVGIVVLMTAIYHIYLCVFSYLADSYGMYASSALASQSFLRNIFGFSAPLFTDDLYEKLGYQWASSFVGFLGAALGIVPFILFFYGRKIRARSKLASQIAKMEEAERERVAALIVSKGKKTDGAKRGTEKA